MKKSQYITSNDPKKFASDLIEYIKSEGKSAGVSDVRVKVSWQDKYKVAVENGEVSDTSEGQIENVSITIYAGDRSLGFQQGSNNIAAIKKAIAENLAVLPLVPPTPDKSLLPAQDVAPAHIEDLDLEDKNDTNRDDIIKYAKAIEREAMAQDKVKAVRSVSFTKTASKIYDMATNGLDITRSRTMFSAGASVIAESENGMQISGEYVSARHFEDLPDAKTVGQKAAENARAKLDAIDLETGEYPIILDNDTAADFFYRVMGGMDGHAVYKGTTLFKDQLGQKILNYEITIEDDPAMPRGLGSQLVDTAGSTAQKINFVEKGVLKSFNVTKFSSKKLGVSPIGRENGTTNTRVLPGSKTPEDLMKDIKKGVLIKGFMGGVMNMHNGTFSRQAYGRLIENGKVTDKAVSGFVVTSSDLKTVFQNLAIANDTPNQKDASSSFCAPTTRLNGMTIAGS